MHRCDGYPPAIVLVGDVVDDDADGITINKSSVRFQREHIPTASSSMPVVIVNNVKKTEKTTVGICTIGVIQL